MVYVCTPTICKFMAFVHREQWVSFDGTCRNALTMLSAGCSSVNAWNRSSVVCLGLTAISDLLGVTRMGSEILSAILHKRKLNGITTTHEIFVTKLKVASEWKPHIVSPDSGQQCVYTATELKNIVFCREKQVCLFIMHVLYTAQCRHDAKLKIGLVTVTVIWEHWRTNVVQHSCSVVF